MFVRAFDDMSICSKVCHSRLQSLPLWQHLVAFDARRFQCDVFILASHKIIRIICVIDRILHRILLICSIALTLNFQIFQQFQYLLCAICNSLLCMATNGTKSFVMLSNPFFTTASRNPPRRRRLDINDPFPHAQRIFFRKGHVCLILFRNHKQFIIVFE